MDFPVIEKKWQRGMHSFDIVFPNKKCGGSYNLGMLILYNIINSLPNWICHRVFLDEGKIKSGIIGFTLQYELDIRNMLRMLKAANIPIDKKSRKQVVIAGGPFVNANPFALENVIDLFVLGDAECVIKDLLELYASSSSKEQFIKSAASLQGVFVPGINSPTYAFVKDLDAVQYPVFQPLPEKITKDYVFGNAFILEIERGCIFSCKFCSMPHRQIRRRSLEALKKVIDDCIRINNRKSAVIYSASFSHPDRKRILQYLLDKGIKFSVPSLRVDLADKELLELIKKGGQKTITIAPECNERLRKAIGKNVSDKQYVEFAKLAFSLGFKELKCYFMIGLPNQTEKDIAEMSSLIKNLALAFRNLYVSINPFVPKPGTEMQNALFDAKSAKVHATLLKKGLAKAGIRYKIQSIATAQKEWELSFAKQQSF